MGRQSNNPQIKGKEGQPEKDLKEIEVRTLSDTEFRVMAIKMPKEQ